MDSNDDYLELKVVAKGELPEITESDIMTVLLDPERHIEVYSYPEDDDRCIYFYVCRNAEVAGLVVSCRWVLGMPMEQKLFTDIDAVLNEYAKVKTHWRKKYGFK